MRAGLALPIVLALLGAACTEEAAGKTWPAGTVLAVGDVPISAAEVDEVTPAIALIEPYSTDDHMRRVALANVVLRRALARNLGNPDEREAARERATNALRHLRAGERVPGAVEGESGSVELEGAYQELGILPWYAAFTLGEGEWSQPLEEAGRFVLVRRVARRDAPIPVATTFAIELYSFPYLPPDVGHATVEAAYDSVQLEIVDPAWRVYVPELIQHRMRARTP